MYSFLWKHSDAERAAFCFYFSKISLLSGCRRKSFSVLRSPVLNRPSVSEKYNGFRTVQLFPIIELQADMIRKLRNELGI